jgi:hypothetical protein
MKKLTVVLIGFALMSAFYACQKDTPGVFNPKMKLNKIYSEEGTHYLLEEWTWTESTLSKIDFYRANGNLDDTHRYLYDEKNRLTRIEADNEYSEFLYDGKLLTTINTYLRDVLVETYKLTYNKNKLSHISITKPSKGMDNVGMLPFFVPGNADLIDSIFPKKDSKIETYNYSSAEIDFQWDGDNVQYMRMKIARPDSIQKLTFSYVYDENLNPKNGFLMLLTDHSLINDRPQYVLCSKNNVLNVLVTNEYDVFSTTKSYTYSYDCYNKFPTKVYSTKIDNQTWEEDSTLIYTYVYLY